MKRGEICCEFVKGVAEKNSFDKKEERKRNMEGRAWSLLKAMMNGFPTIQSAPATSADKTF